MNRCCNFPLLSEPHSLFSIWTNLKRSEKIPVATTRRWGEWIWLTGPSGLHWNSPQGLNISSIRVFDQIRDPEIRITLRPSKVYNDFNINSLVSIFLKSYHYIIYNCRIIIRIIYIYKQCISGYVQGVTDFWNGHTSGVHKVSFLLVSQLENHLFLEATACMW